MLALVEPLGYHTVADNPSCTAVECDVQLRNSLRQRPWPIAFGGKTIAPRTGVASCGRDESGWMGVRWGGGYDSKLTGGVTKTDQTQNSARHTQIPDVQKKKLRHDKVFCWRGPCSMNHTVAMRWYVGCSAHPIAIGGGTKV